MCQQERVNGERLWLQRRERNLKRSLWEPCHLLQAHFTAQRGHWVHNHQSANTFSVCPYQLALFGDCTLERHLHQFLRFFAEFLAVNFAQASNFCFQRGFLFSSSAYLSAASTSDRSACWWRMASRRSLRRLISFFDFFHVMTSDRDKFIASSMRDQCFVHNWWHCNSSRL